MAIDTTNEPGERMDAIGDKSLNRGWVPIHADHPKVVAEIATA
jgi:hypothetical protein